MSINNKLSENNYWVLRGPIQDPSVIHPSLEDNLPVTCINNPSILAEDDKKPAATRLEETLLTTSETVLCPILWGINYHIFMPVRLDEISNSIVNTRLKFV